MRVSLHGVPNSGVYPTVVYASVKPTSVVQDGDSFDVEVPFIGGAENQEYKVLLVANKQLLDTQTVTREVKGGSKEVTVKFTPTAIAPSEFKTINAPDPGGFK